MLDMTLTEESVKARLLSARFRRRQLSALLLDQAFLAGLGNHLRVEILWQVGLSGRHHASALDDKQLDALAHALLDIPRLSYRTRGTVDENKHHGALFRFKVFHRDGEICERRGGIIEKTMPRRGHFTGVRDVSISDTLSHPIALCRHCARISCRVAVDARPGLRYPPARYLTRVSGCAIDPLCRPAQAKRRRLIPAECTLTIKTPAGAFLSSGSNLAFGHVGFEVAFS